jgi:hypothetical protein
MAPIIVKDFNNFFENFLNLVQVEEFESPPSLRLRCLDSCDKLGTLCAFSEDITTFHLYLVQCFYNNPTFVKHTTY